MTELSDVANNDYSLLHSNDKNANEESLLYDNNNNTTDNDAGPSSKLKKLQLLLTHTFLPDALPSSITDSYVYRFLFSEPPPTRLIKLIKFFVIVFTLILCTFKVSE